MYCAGIPENSGGSWKPSSKKVLGLQEYIEQKSHTFVEKHNFGQNTQLKYITMHAYAVKLSEQ